MNMHPTATTARPIDRPAARRARAHARRFACAGVTLVELVVAVAVLGVIGAATLPVIHAAADGYASAVRARRMCEQASLTLDQCLRLVRDLPADADTGVLDIAEATEGRLIFSDGRGLDFSAGVLSLLESPTESTVLLRDVDAFTITYLATDGAADTSSELDQTQRFRLSITLDGFTLSAVALPRVVSIPHPEGES